ncbi:MAG: hypothetical protein ACE5DO_08900 [Desulfobacterales bacterium]
MFWQKLFSDLVGYGFIIWGIWTLYEGLIARKDFEIIDNITNGKNNLNFSGMKGVCYYCLIAIGQFLVSYMIFQVY